MLTFEVRTWTSGRTDRSPGAHREQASVVLPDGMEVISDPCSTTSSICDLCRKLVALGVPDQPWRAGGLRGKSIHSHAKVDISQDDQGGTFGYRPFVAMTAEDKERLRLRPTGRRQDGAEGSGG